VAAQFRVAQLLERDSHDEGNSTRSVGCWCDDDGWRCERGNRRWRYCRDHVGGHRWLGIRRRVGGALAVAVAGFVLIKKVLGKLGII
jgi:hypothetical protein